MGLHRCEVSSRVELDPWSIRRVELRSHAETTRSQGCGGSGYATDATLSALETRVVALEDALALLQGDDDATSL
jgi:hypothetical protein